MDKKMNKYKYGVVSVSFRAYSPKEIIIAAKEADLEYIEWGSDIHAPCDDINRLNEIVKLQKEFGIKCSSYGTYFRLGDTNINELYQYIDAAKILGTNIVRLFCGNKRADKYSEQEEKDFLLQAKMAANIAKSNNVILCMECHHDSYTETAEGAIKLMSYINSPNFCMYWQPNQFVSEIENIEYAGKLSKYIRHIHVFNWSIDCRYSLEYATEIWRKYLSCFDTERILLLEFMPDNKLESLKKEAQALFDISERKYK